MGKPPCVGEKRDDLKPSFADKTLGDIAISLDYTALNAEKIGLSCTRVLFFITHGVLHLCGHDHMNPEEERIMIDQQNKVLALLMDRSKDKSKPLWTDCVSFIKKDN